MSVLKQLWNDVWNPKLQNRVLSTEERDSKIIDFNRIIHGFSAHFQYMTNTK